MTELTPSQREMLELIDPGAADRIEAHMGDVCEWAPVHPVPGLPLRCETCDVDLLPPTPPRDQWAI